MFMGVILNEGRGSDQAKNPEYIRSVSPAITFWILRSSQDDGHYGYSNLESAIWKPLVGTTGTSP